MSEQEKNRGWSVEEYGALAAFDGEWRDTWWNQDFLELMAARWRLEDVETVLDVGCGAGHWGQRLGTLLPSHAKIIGVDHESGFLEGARRRASRLSLPLAFEYRAASAEKLPFDDGTFDVVTCQTVLIHVPDAEAALREMMRVTKPGGLIVASEPNNLANVLVEEMAEPSPSFEDVLRLLRFEALCHQGKIALGQGDCSIGERLPGLFAGLGLVDVRVYKNDRCPALFPPYADREQRIDLEQLFTWIDAEVSGWGRKEDVRVLYLAGGGDPAEFDSLWDLQRGRQRAFKANIEAKRYHGARGFLHYLVSGRRPTSPAGPIGQERESAEG